MATRTVADVCFRVNRYEMSSLWKLCRASDSGLSEALSPPSASTSSALVMRMKAFVSVIRPMDLMIGSVSFLFSNLSPLARYLL